MNKQNPAEQEFIRKLTEITEANLKNDQFGVSQLAAGMGLNRSTLHRKVKTITKKTVSQFICEIRLKKAMEMLKGTSLTAAEVAYDVGFGSPSYFNKCFHNFYGFPPGEIKKQELHNNQELGENESWGSENSPELITPREKERLRIKSPGTRKILWTFIIVAVLLTLINFIYPSFFREVKNETNQVVVDDKSIAILPFKNLSKDESNQYFADGLTEDIQNRLTRIHDLKVISRISSDKYDESDDSKLLPQIATELGVTYILTGSVQKNGNKVRVFVQLSDAREDKQLWSETYSREITDIFAIQADISKNITGALKARISPQEREAIEQTPTQTLTAYDYYLKGRDKYNQYKIRLDELDSKTAIQFYKQALELDSNLAVAYSGLATAFIGGTNYGRYNYGTSEKMLDLAFAFSQKALSIDPNLYEPYVVNGIVYNEKGLNQKSIEAYKKAIELNPNSPDALEIVGHLSFLKKRLDLQLEYREKALDLDPISPERYVNVGFTYLLLDYLDEAEQYFLKAINLQPDFVYAYGLAGYIYLLEGDFQKSAGYFEKQLVYNRDNLWSLYNTGLAYSWGGDYQKAEDYFRKIQGMVNQPDYTESLLTPPFRNRLAYVLWEKGRNQDAMELFNQQIENDMKIAGSDIAASAECYYNLAASNAFLGNKEKTYKWLEKTLKSDGIVHSYRYILNDPLFHDISGDNKFKTIINEERKRILKLRHNIDAEEKKANSTSQF